MQNSRCNISANFTAAHRLLRRDGFSHALHAESVADKCFKIFFSRNVSQNARLGIIASKKTLPGAVDRNCVKRSIREAFRRHSIKASKLDIVVMVRRSYSQKRDTPDNTLETLFSRVESRCAKL